VLGIPRDASDEEIKEAYREKVKKYHPDASERDDSVEMFKRVKDAYEELRSDVDGSDGGSERKSRRDTDTATSRTDSASASSASTASSASDGFGTGRGNGRGNGFGTETDEGYDGARWGTGAREASWDVGSETTDGFDADGTDETEKEDPENFETYKEYGMGWNLGRREKGDWFVFTEVETAPYVEGTKMLYLDGQGRVSTEPVYFGTKEYADEVYDEHYGADEDFGYEHKQDESYRGFSPKGGSHRRRTEERQDDFGDKDTNWGKRRKAADLDVLWKLYYQESRGDEDDEKRWTITTEVTDDDRFVNPAGESQKTEFWFDTRSEAARAYEKYAQRMKEARESFENAGKKAREEDWLGAPNTDEETLVFRVVDLTVSVSESIEEALKPFRERVRIIAAVLTLFLAVSVYLSESLQNLLILIFAPVYVGFLTVFRTPYLMFFVFAYAAIVTVLIVARMSTKY